MDELKAANDRCTCMEVFGEDPNCVLHGIATAWALENTLASEWQNGAIEAADELSALRERVAELEGYVRHKSNCARQPETLHRFACTCGLSAILAKQGGEGV